MEAINRETDMNTNQTEEQKPTEQEPKANPYFGRKCFRTGK
jgi:hypothetical protein